MKIGDIVYSEKYGKGKIVCIDEINLLPLGVKFETFNADLHDLNGRCKSGYGFWCNNDMKCKNGKTYITPYKFTKKDLQIGDKLTTRGGDELIYIRNGDYDFVEIGEKKCFLTNSSKLTADLIMKDKKHSTHDIIKVERPTYAAIFERKEEILDEKEKEYLSGIIRPFKDRVEYIKKTIDVYGEYIHINLWTESIPLPNFEKGSMYKEMELDKEYTLEELGLD